MWATLTVQCQPGYPASVVSKCTETTPSPSSTDPAFAPTASAVVISSRAARARSKSASVAPVAVSAFATLGIQLICDLAEHRGNSSAVVALGVASALEVRADAVEKLHEVFDDHGHVIRWPAVQLGEARRSLEKSHRKRLRTTLAIGDAELELGAGLHRSDPGWQRRGVQEDLLAIIRTDEAEALLVVVKFDLAGGHGTFLSVACTAHGSKQ